MLTFADGKGTRLENKISVQTVDIVMAFKSLGHAYNVQEGLPVSAWNLVL